MFRFLIQFVAVLLLFAVARSVISWLLKTAAASFRATGQQAPAPEARQTTDTLMSTAELYRDPVCGTFVPGTSTFTRNVDGHTLYFCSANCRDRFLVSARG